MVKRSIEQNLRIKNFEARNGNFETTAVVKSQVSKQRVQRILGDCCQWEANGQCSKGDNCSSRHDINKRAKSTQPNPSPSSFMRQNERNASRTRSPRGKSPCGRMARLPCKDYLKGTCTTPFCEKWHPLECLFNKSEDGCRFGERCSYAHRQVEEQPCKRSKKNDDKSAVAMLKITRQLGCVCQDMEPPKSTTILRKSLLKPIRCVRFTKAVPRHANIRDQNQSLGMICPGDPHQRSPNAPKFEDRSQEEKEWQERCAREAAWRLAKISKKSRRNIKTFFSPSEIGACLHQILNLRNENVLSTPARRCTWSAKKDLNSAELETVTTSRSPTTFTTANGEVQTHEEATVHVKGLDIFLTTKVLEDTPVVLSLGKLWDEHGYSNECINVQKPHLIKDGIRIQCHTEKFVPIVVPGLSSSSSPSLPSSTSMTPSRQEIDHSKSSSSLSTSSPTTSLTVSSEGVDRQERGDPYGMDHHPAIVSSERVERQERGDTYSSEASEELLTKQTKKSKTN